MKNVLVREKYSLDNSTLIENASISDFDTQIFSLLIGVLIVLIFMLIRFLAKEKQNNVYAGKYKMEIKWSDIDNAYIVTVPELPGCRTHGSTYEEAIERGAEAIESWIEASQGWGDPIPPASELTIV